MACCGKCPSVSSVISRNILTDPSSSQLTADDADSPAVQSDSSSPPSELSQSDPPEGAAILPEPNENPENTGFNGVVQEESQSGNGSAPVAGQTEQLTLGLRSTAGKESHDPAKPAHADEM